MQPTITVTSLLYLLGSIQALFFASILLADTRRDAAKLLLAIFLLAFALLNFNDFLWLSRYVFLLPRIADLFWPFLFLLGPALWLYVRLLIQPHFRLTHCPPRLARGALVDLPSFQCSFLPPRRAHKARRVTTRVHDPAAEWALGPCGTPVPSTPLELSAG
jgi:hypothetical protein